MISLIIVGVREGEGRLGAITARGGRGGVGDLTQGRAGRNEYFPWCLLAAAACRNSDSFLAALSLVVCPLCFAAASTLQQGCHPCLESLPFLKANLIAAPLFDRDIYHSARNVKTQTFKKRSLSKRSKKYRT